MTTTTSESARIRVNLATGELEIAGTEAFVSQYADSIDAVLGRLRNEGPRPVVSRNPAATPGANGTPPADDGDEPFGEVLHSLSSKSGTDQILLAGYYVAKGAADGTFSTVDASRLLVEQGVKLSNPSQSLKNNVSAKRAFKVGSRFKVSKTGLDYLTSLGVRAS